MRIRDWSSDVCSSDLAELAAATLISRERRIEATAQGAAFHRIASATAAAPALAMLDLIEDDALSYPVAVACLTAGHGIGLEAALPAFLPGVLANLVSAGIGRASCRERVCR